MAKPKDDTPYLILLIAVVILFATVPWLGALGLALFVYSAVTDRFTPNTPGRDFSDLQQTAREMKALNLQLKDNTSTPEYQQTAYAFRLMKTDYLKSTTWDTKRKAVLKRDKYICQQCGATDVTLDVHHMADYILIPHEPTSSLISLCRECHDNEHLLYGYPSSYRDYAMWDHRIL